MSHQLHHHHHNKATTTPSRVVTRLKLAIGLQASSLDKVNDWSTTTTTTTTAAATNSDGSAVVDTDSKEGCGSSSSTANVVVVNPWTELQISLKKYDCFKKNLKEFICVLKEHHLCLVNLHKAKLNTANMVSVLSEDSPLYDIAGASLLEESNGDSTAITVSTAKTNFNDYSYKSIHTQFYSSPTNNIDNNIMKNESNNIQSSYKTNYLDKYEEYIISYVIQWENTVSDRITRMLKTNEKLKLELEHYLSKVSNLESQKQNLKNKKERKEKEKKIKSNNLNLNLGSNCSLKNKKQNQRTKEDSTTAPVPENESTVIIDYAIDSNSTTTNEHTSSSSSVINAADIKLQEKLSRNELKKQNVKVIFEKNCHQIIQYIHEITVNSYKDFFPLLFKMVQFDVSLQKDLSMRFLPHMEIILNKLVEFEQNHHHRHNIQKGSNNNNKTSCGNNHYPYSNMQKQQYYNNNNNSSPFSTSSSLQPRLNALEKADPHDLQMTQTIAPPTLLPPPPLLSLDEHAYYPPNTQQNNMMSTPQLVSRSPTTTTETNSSSEEKMNQMIETGEVSSSKKKSRLSTMLEFADQDLKACTDSILSPSISISSDDDEQNKHNDKKVKLMDEEDQVLVVEEGESEMY